MKRIPRKLKKKLKSDPVLALEFMARIIEKQPESEKRIRAVRSLRAVKQIITVKTSEEMLDVIDRMTKPSRVAYNSGCVMLLGGYRSVDSEPIIVPR